MTSVESTIENARKTINERSGNGPPASISNGIASAAASVTPPRMPAQPMNVMNCQGGVGSRSRRLRDNQRGTYAIGKPQANLTATTTTQSSAAYPSELLPGETVELVEDRSELEADEPEQERVQEEAEDRPEPVALEPRVDGRQFGRVPAHVDACRDDREHS